MTTKNNTYLPDTVSPPGATLWEALSDRSMTQVDLAQRIGMSRKHVKQMLDGQAPITPETALRLERVLGIPARFWNNREQQYRDYLARKEEAEALAHQRAWLRSFKCWRSMVALGWVSEEPDDVARTRSLLNFFAVAAPDTWEGHWASVAVRYRQSARYVPDRFALAAWLRQGEIVAQEIDCKDFDEDTFRRFLTEIRQLTTEPPEVFQPALRDKCAACGVAVVFVPELPKTASGATRWLSPHKALIQLSLKYGTDDHLWFTFFHEAGHILLHRKSDIYIESPGGDSEEERQANCFAADTLISPATLRRFLMEPLPISAARITAFANELSIAPGIVVGRLQHDGHMAHNTFNELKRRFQWVVKAG